MTAKQLDEEAVFHVARSIASPEARAQYLAQVCGDDSALRSRIEASGKTMESALMQPADYAPAAPVMGLTFTPTVLHASTTALLSTLTLP